jgi:DNA-binding LacI/PurR family transcriptional regulator
MDIREIAKRAKVSTATVSRAINHIPTVDPQLAKRVWKVVEELGYYPNTQARALVSGRSRIFGLVISEITNTQQPRFVLKQKIQRIVSVIRDWGLRFVWNLGFGICHFQYTLASG